VFSSLPNTSAFKKEQEQIKIFVFIFDKKQYKKNQKYIGTTFLFSSFAKSLKIPKNIKQQ
jgi:hypothetical protein